MTSVGVVTIVSGRRVHLARQLVGLSRQALPADEVVVVRMDDTAVEIPASLRPHCTVLDLPVPAGGPLPLAAARNLGARALATDAIVLLDVDCIPGRELVCGYADAVAAVDGLVCGVVRYLEPDSPSCNWTDSDLDAASAPHPARPEPRPGELFRRDCHELAWTTSLAMRRTTFATLDGFDERFVGYGAEDTDFAIRARECGFGVWWTGDAPAYHQHHATSGGPPVEHLHDIVRNANLFASLHGWYPMRGWLDDFDRRGLVEFRPVEHLLRLP